MNRLLIETIDSNGIVRHKEEIFNKNVILKSLATMLIENKEKCENYTIEECSTIVMYNTINTKKYGVVTIKRSFDIELY